MGVASAGCHLHVMKYMYVIMYNAKGLAGDKMKYVPSSSSTSLPEQLICGHACFVV